MPGETIAVTNPNESTSVSSATPSNVPPQHGGIRDIERTPEPRRDESKPQSITRINKGYQGLKEIHEGKSPTAPVQSTENKGVTPEIKQASAEPGVTPVEKPVPQNPDSLLEDIEKFEIHQNASPERKKQIAELKEKTRQVTALLKQQIAERDALLADTTGKTKKQLEEMEAKLKKSSRYEHAFDVQADPEFKKKFIEPANARYAELTATLTKAGLTPEQAKQVDWDNEIAIEEVAVALEGKFGVAHANVFRRKASELRGIRADYNAELSRVTTDYDSIVEEKRKERELKESEKSGIAENTLTALVNELGEDKKTPRYAFIKEQEATPGMSKEQLEQLDKHNRSVAQSKGRILEWAKLDDPAQRTGVAVAAELGFILANERPKLLAKITELEAELGKVQNSRSVQRTNGARETTTPVESAIPHGKSISSAFADKFGR